MSVIKSYRIRRLSTGEMIDVPAFREVLPLPADAAHDCPAWIEAEQMGGLREGVYIDKAGGMQTLSQMQCPIDTLRPGEGVLMWIGGEVDEQGRAPYWPCILRPSEAPKNGCVVERGDVTYRFVSGVEHDIGGGVMVAGQARVQVNDRPSVLTVCWVTGWAGVPGGKLYLGEIEGIPQDVIKEAEQRLYTPPAPAEVEDRPTSMSYDTGYLFVTDEDVVDCDEFEVLCKVDGKFILIASTPNAAARVAEPYPVCEGSFLDTDDASIAVHRVYDDGLVLIGVVQ